MADENDAHARDIKTKEVTGTSSNFSFKKSLRIILFREQRERLEENEYEKNACADTHAQKRSLASQELRKESSSPAKSERMV